MFRLVEVMLEDRLHNLTIPSSILTLIQPVATSVYFCTTAQTPVLAMWVHSQNHLETHTTATLTTSMFRGIVEAQPILDA